MRHLAYCTLLNGVKLSRYESDSREAVRRSVGHEAGRRARKVRGRGAGPGRRESRRRQSGRHIHPQRAVCVAAAAAVYAGLRRRRRRGGGGQRRAGFQGGRPRVYQRHGRRPRVRRLRPAARCARSIRFITCRAMCRLQRAPASAFLTSPRGGRSSTEGARARRDSSDPWRKRRRGRRRRADGQRRRIARLRHGRHRTRPTACARAGRARGVRSLGCRLREGHRWRRRAGAASISSSRCSRTSISSRISI